MSTTETQHNAPAFRVDATLHDLLKNSRVQREEPLQESDEIVAGGLPEAIYPQRPEGMWHTDREYHNYKAWRTWKGLGAPYFKSRLRPGHLRPLIAYLFSEWKCNLDCHYCWSYDNSVKGMTEPTARMSIDWLHSIGNRFLALMGGEP